MQKDSYQHFLTNEFVRKTKINPNYTLRSFARDLDICISRLSRILNHKQGLSQERASRICKRLSLSPHDSWYFCTLVAASDSRSKSKRQEAQKKLETMQLQKIDKKIISEEIFSLISSWYHYAILELVDCIDFKQEIKWIADRLNISKVQAQNAVERLFQLGLLVQKNNRWNKIEQKISTSDGVPSKAIRQFNSEILDLAKLAIEFQEIDERTLSTVTTAVDPKSIQILSQKISNFRQEFNELTTRFLKKKNAAPTEVYCMSIQFFRLTQKNRSKNETPHINNN